MALEAIFIRDDLRAAAGLPPAEGEVTAPAIWAQDAKLGPLLEQLPAAKHRRALESFKAANPERWHDALQTALNTVSAKLCRELAGLLIQEGQLEQLKETLARLISQHTASSELLLWLAKERNDSFADILGPEVFRAMLTAMERDQFNERRSNRLRDFILDDQELLVELIGSADLEVIKDLTRALQLSPCFDDMDKRSLLARIVKSYPAIQSLISGEQTQQEATLLVSWESLERRKNEYHELVEKKIPANSKEIAIARSYGDLSENHEYKAAKEMQKLLMRRKADLETQLVRARGTDFANAAHRRRQHRHHRPRDRPGHQPAGALHHSRRVGFRPGEGHHQLSFAGGPGAARPQGRRRSRVRDPRRRPPPSPRLHPALQDGPAPRSVGLTNDAVGSGERMRLACCRRRPGVGLHFSQISHRWVVQPGARPPRLAHAPRSSLHPLETVHPLRALRMPDIRFRILPHHSITPSLHHSTSRQIGLCGFP